MATPAARRDLYVQAGIRQSRRSDDGEDRGSLPVHAEGGRWNDRAAAQPARQALARLARRAPQSQRARDGDPQWRARRPVRHRRPRFWERGRRADASKAQAGAAQARQARRRRRRQGGLTRIRYSHPERERAGMCRPFLRLALLRLDEGLARAYGWRWAAVGAARWLAAASAGL